MVFRKIFKRHKSRSYSPMTMGSWAKAACLTFVIICLSWVFVANLPEPQPWYYEDAPCSYTAEFEAKLVRLAGMLNTYLDESRADYFVCYGTLFGTLRYARSLPWDPDLEFCVIDFDTTYEYSNFTWKLQSLGLSVDYDAYENLFRVILDNEVTAEVILFDYSEDFAKLHRKRGSYIVDEFPGKLLAVPVAHRLFFTYLVPVPAHFLEIQMYFYPKDWWMELKPPNCRHLEDHTSLDHHSNRT